jgi:endoglucanase
MGFRKLLVLAALVPALLAAGPGGSVLKLGPKGYLTKPGLDVFVFTDIYPDGHQTGVTVIQHGVRVAANGDLRLEPAPGQWSPMPVSVGERKTDAATGTITQTLRYPDPTKNGKGFNPIFYPDVDLQYSVHVAPEGDGFRISVDLDKPIPAEWVGKVGFNLELFPTHLFGKSWLMDGAQGIFPRQAEGPVARLGGGKVPDPRNMQPNGPVQSLNGQPLAEPLAMGKTLIVAPEEEKQRLRIETRTGELELIDGRLAHNNGWYIVRSQIAAGATKNAVEWIVTPNVVPNWRYDPVIQVSQIGYALQQPKRAVIELDAAETKIGQARLYKLGAEGRKQVMAGTPTAWGNFLRYRYVTYDFSQVRDPGMYQLEYAGKRSHAFRIDDQVYARHAWQPTLEYFLPAQMCHMLVREKYRVWHGLDHMDDALMAPVSLNHFDGYVQGASTLTRFKPGEIVPGLNAGGWHDAGDLDMRVESQMGTIWLLSRMVEEFGLDYDATTIDQARNLVEIHDPDGKNDAIQQIEHGLLSVLGGYRAMGRLYRGIIEPSLRQYVLLGDAMVQTDNVSRKQVEGMGVDANGDPVKWDDRWVFTEDNPDRELYAAAGLAGAGRALKASNPALAAEAIAAARDITAKAIDRGKGPNRVFALAELIHATGDKALVAKLAELEPYIVQNTQQTGWMLASILDQLPAAIRANVDKAVVEYQAKVTANARTDSPYGIPYVPRIWGAGWDIQKRGVEQYFFHKGWPQATSTDSYVNALNFVLGVHPGENTSSFVSGVGAISPTTAYGTNRADWSYIPGGVISGTNLVRPDLPELKVWPYFWQQTEYVMGGGETNYMFLALAADRLYRKK